MNSATTTPPASNPSAALAPGLPKLLEAWRSRRRAVADKESEVASAKAFLAGIAAEIVAHAGNPARLAELAHQRTAAEQLVRDAPLILQGLEQAARDAGLRWSSAWSEWRAAVEQEILGAFPERRAQLEQEEVAAHREYERVIGAMPTE